MIHESITTESTTCHYAYCWNLAIWCVVQFPEVWVQNCLVTSCHFQASSHFCNQNTFNLQDWLILIACWSLIKIFCQNTLWKKHFLISKTTGRQRKDMFRSRMRCDPKTKCKMAKSITKMTDSSTPFLDQLLWQYLCFAKQFQSLAILRMFHDNMTNDTLLHRLYSSLAHQLPDLILKILGTVQLKCSRTPPWHHISCLDYTT
jgi:hypothetical protein